MRTFVQNHIEGCGTTMPERIETAVGRLQLHEPEEGYWLADSYGKDCRNYSKCEEALTP